MRALLLFAASLLLGACAQGGFDDAGAPVRDAGDEDMDAGVDERPDAGRRDAGGATLPDAGDDTDAGAPVDAGPPGDAGPASADAGTDAGGVSGACSPASDNMEISEVMVASQTGAADRGEWFEIHNLGACPVDLSGLVIDIGGATHTVPSGLLTAGGYFVFAQSSDAAENHMLNEDHAYGGALRMGNSAGSIVLTHMATEVTRVTWGSTDHRTGRSRQLSTGAAMSGSLGGAGWCDSTAVYSMAAGGPFLGTPGMINAGCP